MKTQFRHIDDEPEAALVHEDGLSVQKLRELISSPEAWQPVEGSPGEVRDRVKRRLREKLQEQAASSA